MAKCKIELEVLDEDHISEPTDKYYIGGGYDPNDTLQKIIDIVEGNYALRILSSKVTKLDD